jgi:hypothetical protein
MPTTTIYGQRIERSEYVPYRSVIAAPETSPSGNLVLRVGRELSSSHDHGWEQTEHVVMPPGEAIEFAQAILAAVEAR